MRGGRALLVGVVLALTVGCGPGRPESIAEASYQGAPAGTKQPAGSTAASVAAQWDAPGETVALTTWGSSSCPTLPVSVGVDADTAEITIEVSGDYDGACTADLGPTTSVVRLPEPVDASGPVGLVVEQDELEPATLTLEVE